VIWRSGIFRRTELHKRLLVGVAIGGIILGVLATAMDAGALDVFPVGVQQVVSLLLPLGPVALALGYASILILLFSFTRAHGVLAIFAPLGRMAFTNYILQSLIFGWIFYGYGLGYFGRLEVAPTFALGVFVYVAQMALSAWWLRRYRFGPIEWVWRTLMYGLRQPMLLPRE
jgi:uncharacterized protein